MWKPNQEEGKEGKRGRRKVVRHLWPAGGDTEQFKALFPPTGQWVHSLFPLWRDTLRQ